MSTIRTNTLSNVAGTQSTAIENAINGSAKAWVNFNGTGTVAIRASYNVSSITDNGAGLYKINFTTAMPDTNYVVVSGTWDINVPGTVYTRPDTVNRADLQYYSSSTSTDDSNARVVIFR